MKQLYTVVNCQAVRGIDNPNKGMRNATFRISLAQGKYLALQEALKDQFDMDCISLADLRWKSATDMRMQMLLPLFLKHIIIKH